MRNTLTPLDVIFLSDGGRVQHFHHDAVPNDSSTIPSRVPVSRVLEINRELARKLGIADGDVVLSDRYFASDAAEETLTPDRDSRL